jgi:hypothetical protein
MAQKPQNNLEGYDAVGEITVELGKYIYNNDF